MVIEDAADEEGTPLLGKSTSRWKQVFSARFITSSFSESRERSQRRRKLHTSRVGAAAFLVRDAVLGTNGNGLGQ
jgi:hypothetical protein